MAEEPEYDEVLIGPEVFAVEGVTEVRATTAVTLDGSQEGNVVFITIVGGSVERHSGEPDRPLRILFDAELAQSLAWAILSQTVA